MRKVHQRRSTLRWLPSGFAVFIAALAAVVAIGVRNAQSMPIVRQMTLHMPGMARNVRPAKIALLADIHLGNSGMTPARLAEIVGQVEAAQPDMILLAGDFVTGHDPRGAKERAAGLTGPLAGLRAPFGVIAVLGNHDYWTAPTAVRTALSKAGATILENQAVRRGPFAVVGIGDRFSGHDDVAASLSEASRVGGIPIVLTHSPDLVPDLPANQPLILAGHTHCGQVVLPLIGPLMMHAPGDHWRQLYNPRYRCGIIHDGARTTIVTAGVGSGTSTIRIGAMPDWWLLTLSPDPRPSRLGTLNEKMCLRCPLSDPSRTRSPMAFSRNSDRTWRNGRAADDLNQRFRDRMPIDDGSAVVGVRVENKRMIFGKADGAG